MSTRLAKIRVAVPVFDIAERGRAVNPINLTAAADSALRDALKHSVDIKALDRQIIKVHNTSATGSYDLRNAIEAKEISLDYIDGRQRASYVVCLDAYLEIRGSRFFYVRRNYIKKIAKAYAEALRLSLIPWVRVPEYSETNHLLQTKA